MAFSNNMTKLLNKIETRLGLDILNLPENMVKDKWATDVIVPDTLTTFSRYFPNQIPYEVKTDHPKKGSWYYIDESLVEGVEILGIRDISWADLGSDSIYYQQSLGTGFFDGHYGLSVEDIAMTQMRADHMSLIDNRIYIEFHPPNRFQLMGRGNNDRGKWLKNFNVLLLIKHSPNLTTISPTKMEIFEKLAISDVAGFLYNKLKYYDNLQTVYMSIELKLDELRARYEERDSIIQELKDSYVSSSNDFAPMILTI